MKTKKLGGLSSMLGIIGAFLILCIILTEGVKISVSMGKNLL